MITSKAEPIMSVFKHKRLLKSKLDIHTLNYILASKKQVVLSWPHTG